MNIRDIPDEIRESPRQKGERGKGQDGKNDFLTVSPRRWKSERLKPPAILGR